MPHESEFTGRYVKPYEEDSMFTPGDVVYVDGIHQAMVQSVSEGGSRATVVETNSKAVWYNTSITRLHIERKEGFYDTN